MERQQYITNNGMYFIDAAEKVTKHFRTELQHAVNIAFNSHLSYPIQKMDIVFEVRKAVFKKLLHHKKPFRCRFQLANFQHEGRKFQWGTEQPGSFQNH